MVTKIKFLSIASLIITLSCQTIMFASQSMSPHKSAQEFFEEYNDEFNRYGKPQYKIFIWLQKLFDKDQQTIKNELIKKTQAVKNKDDQEEIISDKEIDEVQKIWDQFKSFYNYDLLDLIMYPLHEPANKENIEKMKKVRKQKPLNLYTHPDKYVLSENNEKMTKFYQYLEDTSRPRKFMDSTIRPIFQMALSAPRIIAFHTKLNLVRTVCSLPSLLLPNYFQQRQFFHAVNSVKTDIKLYISAIKQHDNEIIKHINVIEQHDNAIKKHDNAIKRKDLTISIKQQQARELLDVLFPKNKNFSN